MGWSCRAEAYKILGAWSNACYRQTGSSNEFNVKYKEYFFEVSRTEHVDGSITGTIKRFTSRDLVTG